MFKKREKKDKLIIALVLIAVIVLIAPRVMKGKMIVEDQLQLTGDLLEVHYLDVGQADAVYIGYGDFDMVIDGGNNADGSEVVRYLHDYIDGKLEIAVGTHMHEDHIGGLDQVLWAYNVETIIDSGKMAGSKTYGDYKEAVDSEGAEYFPDRDMVIPVDDRLTVEVMEAGDDFKHTNDCSVIVKVTFDEVSFLFTGDAEKTVEEQLMKDRRDIQATVFKAGHHGSESSNTAFFLSAVKPKMIIIPAGLNNDYGHPHKNPLKRMLDITPYVYGTWKDGTLVVKTDGVHLWTDGKHPLTMEDEGAHLPEPVEIIEEIEAIEQIRDDEGFVTKVEESVESDSESYDNPIVVTPSVPSGEQAELHSDSPADEAIGESKEELDQAQENPKDSTHSIFNDAIPQGNQVIELGSGS